MNRFLKFFVISALAWAIPGNAYFKLGRIWEKTDDQGQQHYVVALGDRHVPNECVATQFDALTKRIPLNAVVICEDSWHQIHAPGSACSWVSSSDDILANVTNFAAKNNIPCVNVEYRQPVGYTDDWYDWSFDHKPHTCGQLADWLEKFLSINKPMLQKCEKFNDAEWQPIHQWFSARARSGIVSLERVMLLFRHASIVNQQATRDIIHANLNYLLTGDPNQIPTGDWTYNNNCVYAPFYMNSNILEMRILQELHAHRNNPAVFICAGASHIGHIEHTLSQMGYIPMADRNRGSADLNQEAAIDVQEFLEPLFPFPHKPIVQAPTMAESPAWYAPALPIYEKYKEQIKDAVGIAGGLCFWAVVLGTMARSSG